MIYLERGDIIIRDLQESDVLPLVEGEIAQGWQGVTREKPGRNIGRGTTLRLWLGPAYVCKTWVYSGRHRSMVEWNQAGAVCSLRK